jgi:GNAT superfamily N-acetyltransferase
MFFPTRHTFVCKTKVGDLPGYHIDNPGHLSDDQKQHVFRSLYPVALSAFSQEPSDEIARDVYNHLFSVDGLLIVVEENDGQSVPVAFRMWKFIEHSVVEGDILYLAGMCVQRSHQGQGIGSALLDYVLHQDLRRQVVGVDQICPLPPCQYVALRTQNPVMKRAFDKATGYTSYPCSVNDDIPEHVQQVAAKVAHHLGDDAIDLDTLTTSGLYGRSLYGHNPHTSDPTYESLFNRMDKTHGDAMVCVWRRP